MVMGSQIRSKKLCDLFGISDERVDRIQSKAVIGQDRLNSCEFRSGNCKVCENVVIGLVWSGCHHQGKSTSVRGQGNNQRVAREGENFLSFLKCYRSEAEI
jgi:hypothetical protein